MKTWWIVVEKQWEADEMYGPYETEEVAYHAMNWSTTIQGTCEEDCLECYLEENDWIPEERRFKRQRQSTYLRSIFRKREVILVDPSEPSDFGGLVLITPI